MIKQQKILEIRDFESLVHFLGEELDWPINPEDFDDLDELAFEFTPEEIGLDERFAAKIREIRQLRPLTHSQPWAVFYIDFEPRRLPITALRRILNRFIKKKRSQSATQATWAMEDLLFITAQGENVQRGVTFAHFHHDVDGGELLREFSWDQTETHLHYLATDYLENLRWPSDTSDANAWRFQWHRAFRGSTRLAIKTSKDLATIMAALAQDIRKRVREVYEVEREDGPLHLLFDGFQKILLHDLIIDSDAPADNKFADLYAQSITYGLFSARAMQKGGRFGLEEVIEYIPRTNPFLKGLFIQCFKAAGHGGDRIDLDELGVNRLVELLDSLSGPEGYDHMQRILQEFGRQTRGEDPVIHFYEGFLNTYEREQRKRRGVYYTPDSVVSYIVRSVDQILRKEFGLSLGLADTTTWGRLAQLKGIDIPKGISPDTPFVQILDPATGTGTFLKHAIALIYETMTKKWVEEGLDQDEQLKKWNEYVPKHLLPRLYGFEIMMAPYAVAHMKVGLKLNETGYMFKSNQRLRVYLTNTLEVPKDFSRQLFAEFLAHEAEEANTIKGAVAITVVFGNPPYSVSSQNRGDWIENEIRSNYYPRDEIKELNPKVLQDDYVKFLRFAQLCIEKTGYGVVGMITNHGYLDNPIFRKMRQALNDTFNEIYTLNLHGNSGKKEVCPDGTLDQNVFDIKDVGTAIGLFFRKGNLQDKKKISYADLWGLRERKYSYLAQSYIDDTEWEEINAIPLFYLFIPQEKELVSEYEQGWKITEIMPINSVGILTARDHFTIHRSPSEVWETVKNFIQLPVEEAREKYDLRKDVRDWKVELAQKDLIASGPDKSKIIPILYRPFDLRFTYYTGQSRGFHCMARPEVMQHMLVGKNIGLIATRQVTSLNYCHANVSRHPIEYKVGSHDRNTQFFPLYLYLISRQSEQTKIYGNKKGEKSRQPNLSSDFTEKLSIKLGLTFISGGTGDLNKTFGPEDVFHYIYAVLHSPSYRSRYAQLLKIDFPRVPLLSNTNLFRSLCSLGSNLISLHLMEAPQLDDNITSFYEGNNRHITKVGEKGRKLSHVHEGKGRLYVNKNTCFSDIPLDVWDFHIGGYQVCHKWLSDRKKAGAALTDEDIIQYQRIVVAFNETIRLMSEIDKSIEGYDGWPIS